MREVAGLAAFDAHRRVLVNERTALIGVAFEARLFISERLLYHAWAIRHAPRRGEGSMRIVAVRALHESFVHAMLGRHLELSARPGMTPVTEFALFLGQEVFRSRRVMDGVAAGASHI